MKEVNKKIENWIKPFATIIGEKIEVDDKLRESNPANYFLKLTLPNRFEKYALALHSYWINYNLPKDEIKEHENEDEELSEDAYSRLNWKEFYKLKRKQFVLNNAILSTIDLNREFTQMNNELYPGEGLLDKEHIESLAEEIRKLYGDEEIDVFYTFLSTSNLEQNKMFECKISELVSLLDNKELRLTPSLIYPKSKKWAINTDYDLPFTTIGGEKELIDNLIVRNQDEIYEIEY